jgi:adenylate cyclase
LGPQLRYWYTYRTAVAVAISIALSASIYWLYTQQLACDQYLNSCIVRISIHPEDRFAAQYDPGPDVVIVGIDDKTMQQPNTRYPLPRERYATALAKLQAAGAQAVGLDIAFPDQSESGGDDRLAKALREATVPVVLSYAGGTNEIVNGRLVQKGVDEIPLKKFWCSDTNPDRAVPCAQPYPNVLLASTDLLLDRSGVVRRIPLTIEPRCFSLRACNSALIDTFGFTAYRAAALGKDFQTGPDLKVSGGVATFGQAWKVSVDSTGSLPINYSGPPGNFKSFGHYVSFGDLIQGTAPADKFKDKIVLIGAYELTGVNDEQLVTTSFGSQTLSMAGVEIHANVIQMLLGAVAGPGGSSKFLTPEPRWLVFLLILLLAFGTALGVSRLTVLWGLAATAVALAGFTLSMAFVAAGNNFVPDLFHPWLALGLTYSGVTAYRFLYEDREKRKVTALFSHVLKPEIVAELAKTRRGVEDIVRGGDRRDITLLFADIRGFTSMSESMEAKDVTEVIQMYLDHLSGIIFTWDGTLDKYIGDEIMAFWNAPRHQENHALLALRCAYDLISKGPELEQMLLEKGLPPIRWGIGINTGPAVVGFMGSRSRLQYTALGDTVNTAARFCSHAPAFQALIGQETYELCKDYIAVDLVPGVQLKGKSAEKFQIYQVTAIRETPTSPWVPFPTETASQAHLTYTSQYTQRSVIAAGDAPSKEILVGDEAEQALARPLVEEGRD